MKRVYLHVLHYSILAGSNLLFAGTFNIVSHSQCAILKPSYRSLCIDRSGQRPTAVILETSSWTLSSAASQCLTQCLDVGIFTIAYGRCTVARGSIALVGFIWELKPIRIPHLISSPQTPDSAHTRVLGAPEAYTLMMKLCL